jgi:hypothetical protein
MHQPRQSFIVDYETRAVAGLSGPPTTLRERTLGAWMRRLDFDSGSLSARLGLF